MYCRPGLPRLLVVGAGGTLGAAVLAEALVEGRFGGVGAVVAEPVASALRGFDPLPAAALHAGAVRGAEIAIVVFERARHSNGRDEAFLQPAPDELPMLARRLRVGGVRRLLVVVPHAPALLPQALKGGFATMAEGEVAALGFEHLVFVRAAQEAAAAAPPGLLPRFAAWWLGQLKLMVPEPERPLRAQALAALVVQLAQRLPQLPPGTRVLGPEALAPGASGRSGRSGRVRAQTPR
jgi:hypothetical protein